LVLTLLVWYVIAYRYLEHEKSEVILNLWSKFFLVMVGTLFMATSTAAQMRGQKKERALHLRELLAKIDQLRLPRVAVAEAKSQIEILGKIGQELQKLTEWGIDSDVIRGMRDRIHLQEKLMQQGQQATDVLSWQLLSHDLWQSLIQVADVDFLPSEHPNFSQGRSEYLKHCAECHAEDGSGKGLLAAKLPVPPSLFTSERLGTYDSPLRFYTAMSMGTPHQGMPAFETILTQPRLWDLAFYLQGLRLSCGPQPLNQESPVQGGASQLEEDAKLIEELLLSVTLNRLVYETDDSILAFLRQKGVGKLLPDSTRDAQILHHLRCRLAFHSSLKRH
jgi:mono/diheme cytochrome c family protein